MVGHVLLAHYKIAIWRDASNVSETCSGDYTLAYAPKEVSIVFVSRSTRVSATRAVVGAGSREALAVRTHT